MIGPRSKSFPIKNGFCLIYPDKLEINQEDLLGKLEKFLYSKGVKTRVLLYMGLVLVLLIAFLISVSIANYFLSAFFLVLSGATVVFLLKNRKLSLATEIIRKNIQQVTYKEPLAGVSRAMFLITFTEEGKTYLKKLQLPPNSQQGQMVAQSAFLMMRDEGLIQQ
ncbi:MAG: hypothetical protein AAF824_07785 [Bacteroidota bacterium]